MTLDLAPETPVQTTSKFPHSIGFSGRPMGLEC
jgi:hypothetical protein